MKNYAIGKKRPETLQDLYRRAAINIWGGKVSAKISGRNLEEIIQILENPKLSDITTEMVDDLVGVLSVGRADGTVNNKLATLSTILKYAHARGWIEKLPVFSWKDKTKHRTRWLRGHEEKILMERLPDDVRAFCTILVDTGMRRGELLSLTKDQIEGDFIHLQPDQTKTKRARSIPMSPRAKALIQQWVPFKDMTPCKIRHHWIKAKEEAGITDKDLVIHTLRHTAATRMLAATNNLVLVKELLGHTQITTTMRYAHVNPQQLLEAVNKVHLTFAPPQA